MYLWYYGIMCNRNLRCFILFVGVIIFIYEIIDCVWIILFYVYVFNIGDFLIGIGRDNLLFIRIYIVYELKEDLDVLNLILYVCIFYSFLCDLLIIEFSDCILLVI